MPAIAATPNCGTQLERAIRAWLVECEAGTMDDIFTSNDYRTHPDSEIYTTILAATSRHTPENAGNEVWQVVIQHFYPANVPRGHSSPESFRVAMDNRVGVQLAAMAQTNDNVNLDATAEGITTEGRQLVTGTTDLDMADFTCLFVRYMGAARGKPEDESCTWVESRNYEITACPHNVD